jgi:Tol biopolymer transport system component
MLAGGRAFSGASSVEVMAAILKEEPPELPATVPPGVRSVVRYCLEKDPGQRFQCAKDLAFDLRELSRLATSQCPEPVRVRKIGLWAVAPIVGCLFCAGTILGVSLADRPGVDLSRLKLTPVAVDNRLNVNAIWSPQGRSFAFIAGDEPMEPPQLVIRSLDASVAKPIGAPMTHGVNPPVFSKDGGRVYFTATSDGLHRELWTVSLAGGAPQRLFPDLGGFLYLDGLAITPDGKSLVVAHGDADTMSLWLSSPPGAPLQKLDYPVFKGRTIRVWLRFSPDGKQLLTVVARTEGADFWISSWPLNGAIRKAFPNLNASHFTTDAAWMVDGRHVVMALAPDPLRFETSLYIADTRTGNLYPTGLGRRIYSDPAVSPDGKVLISIEQYDQDIVGIPLDGSATTNLIATGRNEVYPDWSPVDDQMVSVTDRNGPQEIWLKSASGQQERPLVTQEVMPNRPVMFRAPVFSPDGQRIAFDAGGTAKSSGEGGAAHQKIDCCFLGNNAGINE